MLISRTLGSVLLGSPTLTQLGLASFLAAVWGFLPGFDVAPLSIALMLALLLILKANLALALIIASVSRLMALIMMPLTFKLGVFLLEGPMGGFFEGIINSSAALMGFDYYITAGAWLVGLLMGALWAWQVTFWVGHLRTLFTGLEKDGERYQKLVEKGWVRFGGWLFLGLNLKEEKPRFEQVGGPIRWAGVATVVVVVASLALATPLIEGYFAKQIRAGLERANGASVDVSAMKLSFADSRLTIEGLALADPSKLTHDRFRAKKVEVDLSVRDLFRRRLVLDRVEASGGEMDVLRATKGIQVEVEEDTAKAMEVPGYSDLVDYYKKAQELRARLREVKRFLEDMSGKLPEPGEQEQTFEEWLEDQILLKGYEYVRALHKVKGSPAFLLRHFKAHEVSHSALEGEYLNIDAWQLSTHPQLVNEPSRLSVVSSGKTFELGIALKETAAQPAPSQVNLAYRRIPMERITQQLQESAEYLQGGTVDVSLKGDFKVGGGSFIDLPLEGRLKNVTLQLPRVDPVVLTNFPVVVQIKGSLDNPKLKFDSKAFLAALKKEGFDAVVESYKQQFKEEVDARVEEEKEKLTKKAKERLEGELGDKLDGELGDKLNNELGDQLGGLLGGSKKEGSETQEGEAPAKEGESAGEKGKLDAGGLLGGLLKDRKKKAPEKANPEPPKPSEGEDPAENKHLQ